jgi:hypothetical protein
MVVSVVCLEDGDLVKKRKLWLCQCGGTYGTNCRHTESVTPFLVGVLHTILYASRCH